MSLALKRRWIIEDLRDRYSVAGIAKRRGVSEDDVRTVWREWSRQRKREADRRSYERQKLKKQAVAVGA
jgi:hypothetical protein